MANERPESRESGQADEEATIDAEERRQDDETAREARDEAEALGAVPFERTKKEHEDEDEGGPPDPA